MIRNILTAVAATALIAGPVSVNAHAPIVGAVQASTAVALASDGVKLRSGDVVGFGTSQDDVVQFLTDSLGAPTGSTLNEDCDGGALGSVDYRGGLRLYFKAGKLVGWEAREGSRYATVSGIALGMRYTDVNKLAKDVEAEDSSLGVEFTADGYHGLLSKNDPDGTVTTMWAGTICANR